MSSTAAVKATCATCRHWAGSTRRDSRGFAACRHRSPVLLENTSGWPTTTPNDWCGEHEPLEGARACWTCVHFMASNLLASMPSTSWDREANCYDPKHHYSDDGHPRQGKCRALPPQPSGLGDDGHPKVNAYYLCGAYRRRPSDVPVAKELEYVE